MRRRQLLVLLLAVAAVFAASADRVVAGVPMAAYLKIDGLLGGPGQDRAYPGFTEVSGVMVNGTRVDTCAGTAQLDNDPIGMLTVQIARTKGYIDEASVGLRKRAESGDKIEGAVLAISEGRSRCEVSFGGLSDLAVERSGDFDVVTLSFEEIKVTMQ